MEHLPLVPELTPVSVRPRSDLDYLCVNALRFMSVDIVQNADSGHPGLPLGAAGMAFALWDRFLKFNPNDPDWPDRDRFVLSAGHGCALLYSLLHLMGYDLTIDDLKRFRQWESRTPGHPEYLKTPGVEATTGPLGQGFGNAVGMALAEQALASRFNRPGHTIVDHFTFVLASDGDMMEGVSSEAASLAGHLRLGKLIVLYDENRISIEGNTNIAFTEDVCARFAAYHWHVQQVDDGNDLMAVSQALELAKKTTDKPSFIAVRTHIGFGSPHKQDTLVWRKWPSLKNIWAGLLSLYFMCLKKCSIISVWPCLGVKNTNRSGTGFLKNMSLPFLSWPKSLKEFTKVSCQKNLRSITLSRRMAVWRREMHLSRLLIN
jgi:transketolase